MMYMKCYEYLHTYLQGLYYASMHNLYYHVPMTAPLSRCLAVCANIDSSAVHYTHAAAGALNNRGWSLAIKFHFTSARMNSCKGQSLPSPFPLHMPPPFSPFFLSHSSLPFPSFLPRPLHSALPSPLRHCLITPARGV